MSEPEHDTKRRCEGPGCKTMVGGTDPFCSEWCRNVAFDVLPERFPCRCGHVCCGGDTPSEFGCADD